LHIQVHAKQENYAERNQCPQSNHHQPAQLSHPEMLRSASLKQTSKPDVILSEAKLQRSPESFRGEARLSI